MTGTPSIGPGGERARARLDAVAAARDGLDVAKADLALRRVRRDAA